MAMMQREVEQPAYDMEDREPEFSDPAYYYSRALRDLVKSCVRYDPTDRPTFEHLQTGIQRHTAGPGAHAAAPDLAEGMRIQVVPGGLRDLTINSSPFGRRYPLGAMVRHGAHPPPLPGFYAKSA